MDDKRLGCLTTTGFLAGILTILIVLGMVLVGGGELFSPGQLSAKTSAQMGGSIDQAGLASKSQSAPLHLITLGGVTSHAGLNKNCTACHTGFWEAATMADRCVVCHTDITAQKQDPSTLHGNLQKNNPELVCQNCHPDHKGPQNSLTDFKKVNLAHDAFGYATTAHGKRTDGTPFQCSDCHTQNYLKVDLAVCTTCHQQINAAFLQPHLRAYGNNCLACHDGIDTYGHNFDHNKVSFKLTGLHAPVSCEKCHQNAQTLAALRSTPTDCASCHKKDDPHSDRLSTDCAGCHKTDGWTPASFNHKAAAFQLQGKHTSVPCESCHVNNIYKGTPTDCASCHKQDDQHNGQLGTDCALCHDNVDWRPAHFDHTSFPLTGKHGSAVCTSCHINKVIKGLPTDCAACHANQNPHPGEFGTNCAICHTAAAWLPATFNHNLAAFKLSGKHAQVACASCHVNNVYKGTPSNCYACHKADDKHGGQYGTDCALCHSSAGWKPASFDHSKFPLTGKHTTAACTSCHTNNVFKGTPTSCNSCHSSKNPHSSQFGTNCAICHSTAGWLPATFNHNLAAFKLSGKHVQIACTSCHVNNVYKGTPSNCYACHKSDDKHGGQYGTNCAQCHSSTGWKPANFDHTKFPLSGKHATAACASCHTNQVFKGTPISCNSCHSSKNPHSNSLGTNCGNCHTTAGWLPATFDHSTSAFKLSGKHVQVACTSCHVNNVYKGTPSNCYACHKSDDKHGGQYGTNCAQCHSSTGWKPANFDHTKFPLSGKHATAACASCHTNQVFKGTPISCNSCHSSKNPHSNSLGTNCGNCHTTAGWLPATFDHSTSAFKLTGAHVQVSCTRCHVNNVYKGTPSTCYACHKSDDKHNGQFGNDCGSCHSTSKWQGVTFDHNTAAFKLTGAHVQVSCKSCHVNNVYKGTPSTCNACHKSDDKHNGQFGTNCGSCHTTTKWQGATFNHNTAAFKLTGAHVQASCTSCHVNNVYKGTPTNCNACHKADDKHNGAFGTGCGSCHSTSKWQGVTFDHNTAAFKLTGAHVQASCTSCHVNNVYKGTPSTCNACHKADDKHNGAFGTGCGSCHSTSKWQGATFDHNTAAFKLTGAHVQASCTSCHVNNVYKGTPTNCNACHNDEHNGSNGTKCSSCHTTNTWKPANFDHSGFALTNGHAGLSCDSCHSSGKYSGLSKDCSSCHSEPSYHAGLFSSNCAQCHSTSNWNASYTGTHPKNCDGSCLKHHKATCRDCHTVNLSTFTCKKCHDSNNPGD